MTLFLDYLNRHISGSEHMLRGRMKKSYDRIVKAAKLSAEPTYCKWLANKIYTYHPQHTWVDEPTATSWAINNIPDFEFLVQMIAAAHFTSWFGKWLSINKSADMGHRLDKTDFTFDDPDN